MRMLVECEVFNEQQEEDSEQLRSLLVVSTSPFDPFGACNGVGYN